MLNLKNITIKNCGVGISAPKDVKMNVDGLVIEDTGEAIQLRDEPSVVKRSGFRPRPRRT
jgi:hypothetical protein